MAKVFDVAAYILERKGPMTAMKLQKLLYYAQAWSLVWDERPLFSAKIKAWANGPVVPDVYQAHKGRFSLSREHLGGDPSELTEDERETVDAVLKFYGDRSAQWLSDLTHREAPWRQARGDATADDNSVSAEITHAAMAEYYAGIDPSQ